MLRQKLCVRGLPFKHLWLHRYSAFLHRFYVGKIGTGILQLITLGGLGIWALVDFIMIVTGNFKDKQELAIKSA
ncbi:TM2 domain-containing protein [candidate division KSB1 bacterium]|nr:TM2 domain-containing protein [candidate division KSB1 bacterium]TDJ74376.1 MAG: TM2 domain-containing protein [Pseudomonadota bacterium]